MNRIDVEIDEGATASPRRCAGAGPACARAGSDAAVHVVENAIDTILKREGYSADPRQSPRQSARAGKWAHVTVLLTGDARLKQLNRDFAGEDHVTDVLSFPLARSRGRARRCPSPVREGGAGAGGSEPIDDFPDPEYQETNRVRLGDIAISAPQTRRQAIDKGVPFQRELAMLAIHGTLHLLGYDHAEPEEERVMFEKTDDALEEIFHTR